MKRVYTYVYIYIYTYTVFLFKTIKNLCFSGARFSCWLTGNNAARPCRRNDGDSNERNDVYNAYIYIDYIIYRYDMMYNILYLIYMMYLTYIYISYI